MLIRRLMSISKAPWAIEIAAVTASIASLAAIIIILALHDGNALADWTFYFSLNTVVSLLATTTRATMFSAVAASISQSKWNLLRKTPSQLKAFQTIDQASRGGAGSFILIWSLYTA